MPYKNIEQGRKRAKEYYYENREKCLEAVRKYCKEHKKKNLTCEEKEKQRELWRKGYKKAKEKDPQRWKARVLLKEAVKTGLLKRLPCQVCGRKPSQAHHEDYNFPLSVIWYCTFCHRKRHEQIKGFIK